MGKSNIIPMQPANHNNAWPKTPADHVTRKCQVQFPSARAKWNEGDAHTSEILLKEVS